MRIALIPATGRMVARWRPIAPCVLSPAATQRLVEVDEVVQPRQARAHQGLLRTVLCALRIEQGEAVVHAFLEALLG